MKSVFLGCFIGLCLAGIITASEPAVRLSSRDFRSDPAKTITEVYADEDPLFTGEVLFITSKGDLRNVRVRRLDSAYEVRLLVSLFQMGDDVVGDDYPEGKGWRKPLDGMEEWQVSEDVMGEISGAAKFTGECHNSVSLRGESRDVVAIWNYYKVVIDKEKLKNLNKLISMYFGGLDPEALILFSRQ
jgi:hypothetical protein